MVVFRYVQDDYRVCMAAGILRKGGRLICPVDDTGCFTSEVPDFAKQHVKVSPLSSLWCHTLKYDIMIGLVHVPWACPMRKSCCHLVCCLICWSMMRSKRFWALRCGEPLTITTLLRRRSWVCCHLECRRCSTVCRPGCVHHCQPLCVYCTVFGSWLEWWEWHGCTSTWALPRASRNVLVSGLLSEWW